ncbi:uncharacterized protein CXQ87_003910 [Candidozyma duobushaemuli]|uniref:Uncharacterized protein n=2 Tax=Candidozyma TaxID=3303203 RepID=A0ABX8IBJ1_9ASCO|nr:uncharacterized protein CXQ87_003910 [[Candida] duobushaemulonis]PVH16047.1 hypothetical protein CXQ87_003910 [[Candida] duobushaemulonis]QWU89268.1 hypothetical protein CA3LBN_003591 [[Candida] haemuloni]
MGRIELVTQPSKENLNEEALREATLNKLHKLVNENRDDDDKEATKKEKEGQVHGRKSESPVSSPSRTPSPEVDYDGFEVPSGKIPIDGNFSTSEVKELIELAREDGALGADIDVKVLERNALGNRVVVSEKEQQERERKEKEGAEGNESSDTQDGESEKDDSKKDDSKKDDPKKDESSEEKGPKDQTEQES